MTGGDVTKFIAMVETFFPRPKFSGNETNEAFWVATMENTLGGFGDAVLVKAANIIIETRSAQRDGTMFPKPAECIAACHKARDVLKSFAPQPLLAAPNANEWSDERLDLAFDLDNGELGKRAAREGWISQLYNFCRKEMRLPKSSEIAVCIEQFELLEQAIAAFNAGPRAGLNGAICAFADTVLVKRAELRERVLHGVIS